MTIDNKDGAAFLAYVTDKLETRIAHISQSILGRTEGYRRNA